MPLPESETFDRLAGRTTTERLVAFIKADIRNRMRWRRASEPSPAARKKSGSPP